MSPVEAAITGAVAMALVVVIAAYVYRLTRKVYGTLAALAIAVRQVAPALKQTVVFLESIQKEMTLLRVMMTPQGSTQEYSDEANVAALQRDPVLMPQYMGLDRFHDVKDATVEDNDIELLKQTDEDLVEIEQKEMLREQGVEMEDEGVSHLHEAIGGEV